MNVYPEWLPVDSSGTAWRYVSRFRRVLGTVVKTGDKFRGRKLCCSTSTLGDINEAAAYVRTALKCSDCYKQ